MSLAQLDAFLAQARRDPELGRRLAEPLELDEFLALAASAGFVLSGADVLAARERQEETLSDVELQRQAGEEARRLRHFVAY